jgi:hypothetical protein
MSYITQIFLLIQRRLPSKIGQKDTSPKISHKRQRQLCRSCFSCVKTTRRHVLCAFCFTKPVLCSASKLPQRIRKSRAPHGLLMRSPTCNLTCCERSLTQRTTTLTRHDEYSTILQHVPLSVKCLRPRTCGSLHEPLAHHMIDVITCLSCETRIEQKGRCSGNDQTSVFI